MDSINSSVRTNRTGLDRRKAQADAVSGSQGAWRSFRTVRNMGSDAGPGGKVSDTHCVWLEIGCKRRRWRSSSGHAALAAIGAAAFRMAALVRAVILAGRRGLFHVVLFMMRVHAMLVRHAGRMRELQRCTGRLSPGGGNGSRMMARQHAHRARECRAGLQRQQQAQEHGNHDAERGAHESTVTQPGPQGKGKPGSGHRWRALPAA